MEPKQVVLAIAAIGVGFWLVAGMKESAKKAETTGLQTNLGPIPTVPMSGLGASTTNLMGDKPLPEHPEQLQYTGEFGLAAGVGGMMGANGAMYFVANAVTPETLPYLTEKYPVPQDYDVLPAASACSVRPVADGEELANVFIFQGKEEAGLQVFGMDTFAQATGRWLQFARQQRDPSFGDSTHKTTQRSGLIAKGNMKRVDVFVGRTEKPVYVLLQSKEPGVLWNVIAGPDAQIAHIAAVAGGTVAVAPPANVETLELLDTTLADCGFVPVQEPQKEWGALTGREQIHEDKVKWYYQTYFAYSEWFERTLGKRPSQNIVGGYMANHLLVGQMPTEEAPRFNFRPISQQKVYVSEAEFVLAGTNDDVAATVMQMERDTIARMLGGDITQIIPANFPVEMPAPIVTVAAGSTKPTAPTMEATQ